MQKFDLRVLAIALAFNLLLILSTASVSSYQNLGLTLEVKVVGFDNSIGNKALVLILWDAVNDRVIDVGGKLQNTAAKTLYLSQEYTDKDRAIRPWLESYYSPSSLTNRYVMFFILVNEFSGGGKNADDFYIESVKMRNVDGSIVGSNGLNFDFGEWNDKTDYVAGAWRITLGKNGERLASVSVLPINTNEDSGFVGGSKYPNKDGQTFWGYREAIMNYVIGNNGDAYLKFTQLIFALSSLDYSGWEPSSGNSGSGGGVGGGSWNRDR